MGKINHEECIQHYNAGLSDKDIAEKLGVSSPAVAQWRKKNGLTANNARRKKTAPAEVIEKPAVEEAPLPAPVPVIVPDAVNHPSHYKSNGMEVIDVIEAFELDFSLGNAVKYVLRAGHKDEAKTIEDLEKAIWYIKRKIEKLGGAS